MGVGAPVSLKVATKRFLRVKKLWKFRVLGYFSKSKTEECHKKGWHALDQFDITLRCWATYFLKVGDCVSLKVVTEVFFRGKKPLKI